MNHCLDDMQILVADDDPDGRDLMRYFLERQGAEVTLANDGREVIEATKAKLFHLILLDVEMPKLDGYRTAMELRHKGIETPIVMLSGHCAEAEKIKTYRYNEHITKPILPNDLVLQLQKYKH